MPSVNRESRLDDIHFADPNDRGRAEQLLTDIETRLMEQGGPRQAVLLDNIEETVTRFEIEHPRFAAGLNQVMAALSSMGI